MNLDAVPAHVVAVEHDGVSVDALDREVVLGRGNDEAALVRAAVEEDRVARLGRGDRLRDGRLVLGNANRRGARIAAREAECRDDEDGGERQRAGGRDAAASAQAFASSSSFLLSAITFWAMCAGTSS